MHTACTEQYWMKKNEIIKHLACSGNEAGELYSRADRVTRSIYGTGIFIRGIIEFSNLCTRDCIYCGIRKSAPVKRYEMDYETIMFLLRDAIKQGYRTIVLQSGEYAPHDDMITDVIRNIKNEHDIVITLSLGERPLNVYRQWRDAGAERYLLRIETFNRELFRSLHPDDDFDERLEALKMLKDLKFETGTGVMIGLPGQTMEHLADDLLFFRDNDFDMLGVGPFLPHRDTPLRDADTVSAELVMNFVALMRLLTVNTNIPATTSMGTLKQGLRSAILNCGANVIMPNHTPMDFRDKYMLYDNKIGVDSEPDDTLQMAINDVIKADKSVSWQKGFRNRI